jgi:hypothetical protein
MVKSTLASSRGNTYFEEAILMPRQPNGYDCGVFALSKMECCVGVILCECVYVNVCGILYEYACMRVLCVCVCACVCDERERERLMLCLCLSSLGGERERESV